MDMIRPFPISMDEMLLITKAVSRGCDNGRWSLQICPFSTSYQTSVEDAVKNAGILIKDGGAGAVKIEGVNAGIKAYADVSEIMEFQS